MRKLAALVMVLTFVPVTPAFASDLGELLDRSRAASYTAEQIISCSTPDGVRDALVRVTQTGGTVTVSSTLGDDLEVAAGAGTWALRRDGGLVASAAVDEGKGVVGALYSVEEQEAIEYLGRAAMSYLLVRDGVPRAELVIDDQTGAVVDAVSYTIDGEVYCERRFVSIDDAARLALSDGGSAGAEPPSALEESALPATVSGFQRLDQYVDEDGVMFAYYSDGFFSFALFETTGTVDLPDAVEVELGRGEYQRVFTAGQVFYVWETPSGGAALVGDLPPDLHEAVLAEMPQPQQAGFFRRWWRSLFG